MKKQHLGYLTLGILIIYYFFNPSPLVIMAITAIGTILFLKSDFVTKRMKAKKGQQTKPAKKNKGLQHKKRKKR